MTSYRRDGRIVKEAIDDINVLRDYIVDKIGISFSLCLFPSLFLLSLTIWLAYPHHACLSILLQANLHCVYLKGDLWEEP